MLLFHLPIREGLISLATTTGAINLRLITFEQAADLWRDGSCYVTITAAGAMALFRRSTVKVVMSYLAMCKTAQEVRALRAVHPRSATLRKACTLRLRAMRELGVRAVT